MRNTTVHDHQTKKDITTPKQDTHLLLNSNKELFYQCQHTCFVIVITVADTILQF